jgi:dTDP-glucose 4,6-dehydratase/UDP-glucose 4-epimerase
MKHYLVTGGTGFLGAALVRRLVEAGHRVRILDNNSRGDLRRLQDVTGEVEFKKVDIRDVDAVESAVRGVDCVVHLAFVNGTEFFYTQPELVLDVGVRGMLNVLAACRSARVRELVVASSSEVYQSAPVIPTDELVPLSIPDVTNPRYSYAGGKILSELLALNYGRQGFDRVVIFRPHNVYGPDMGWEHVIPQFIVRLLEAGKYAPSGPATMAIQGDGQQSRAFIYIDDFIDGLLLLLEHGEHLNVYHIGNPEEVKIIDLAKRTAACLGREVRIVPGPPASGGALRRCPDITKMMRLGFVPRIFLDQGLPPTVQWYVEHVTERAPAPGSGRHTIKEPK